MDPRHRDRIPELYERARRLDSQARRRLLDESCRGEPELRAAVEALLARGADEVPTTQPTPPPAPAPSSIGPYRILSKLGEGGMGIAWLAERREPRQRVALKVVKPGMDSASVLARFDSERQALALMNHPNVARILDAGSTAEGAPYFVMEYVAGVPITEHCDRHRLSLHERLALFAQVCDGVHHAHQKGILHRDLKPSNVLVQYEAGRATPKIIDFGVAKALHQPLTTHSLFTAQGQLVGTPEYMSPEQAQLTTQDVDVRSDVYSLGVLLYELLTGALPFDRETLRAAGLDGMLRLIRESDPPRPSTRLETLDTSDPERSSETARRRRVDPRTLARRLRDDLDWIVMMCLEKDRSRRYESATALADDVRRHLALEPVRARPPSAAYRAGRFWKRHRVALSASAAVLAVLLAAIVGLTALAASNHLKQVQLDERRARDLVEEARRLVLPHPRDAARKLEAALALDPDSAEARRERARWLRHRGRHDEAIAEARAVVERDPRDGKAAALLAGLLRRSDPQASERFEMQARGSLEASELHASLALAEVDDGEAIRLLTLSLEANPWNFDALWERCQRGLRLGDFESALPDAKLLSKVRGDLAMTWNLAGAVSLEAGRLEEALARFDRALERDERSWIAWYNRGLAHARAGHPERAIADYDRSIEAQPDEPDVHRERANSLMDLGRLRDAVAAYERVIDLGADAWEARWDLGAARFGAGDYATAAAEFAAAISLLPDETAYDGERLELSRSRAQCSLALRDLEAARADLERVDGLGARDGKTAALWGRLERLAGDFDRAGAHFDEAIALEPEAPTHLLERGVGRLLAADTDAAVEDFARFARSDHPDAPWVRLWLVSIERERRDSAAAQHHLSAAETAGDPSVAAVVRALRGEIAGEAVERSAASDERRLAIRFVLGEHALAESDREAARSWFERCTALGLTNHLEHEIAEWRLGGLGG